MLCFRRSPGHGSLCLDISSFQRAPCYGAKEQKNSQKLKWQCDCKEMPERDWFSQRCNVHREQRSDKAQRYEDEGKHSQLSCSLGKLIRRFRIAVRFDGRLELKVLSLSGLFEADFPCVHHPPTRGRRLSRAAIHDCRSDYVYNKASVLWNQSLVAQALSEYQSHVSGWQEPAHAG